ncbi:MAG: hypothetical protein K8F52_16085 [Candidatus Scalindua rubra]|uniref:Uncharacterized protein n=1 Tax=Candidatus Scalindua brodae TaxID=237368 RepID=A0A0B0ELA1_9BACT|nr:MAG: hypothetical protein SCABRO_02791 [Candidatus Scalindua brodae]MBZ0110170.1 hypothetical protein [Candidatus Scalindua rubra]
MKSKTKTDYDLYPSEQPFRAGERTCCADIGKIVLEGMMTVFIVLIFLFVVQNWVLRNADDTPFAPTCRLTEGGVGVGWPVSYETDKTADVYKSILQ